jgi:uncharacterized protein YcfJ
MARRSRKAKSGKAAIDQDPALKRTAETGASDRARDTGKPARLQPDLAGSAAEIATGAAIGAVTGGVTAGPVGAVVGAGVGAAVGAVTSAPKRARPEEQPEQETPAGDVADVDSDGSRVRRTYSGQVYEEGSVLDTRRKDVI